jgi:hypothetical protein
MFGQRPLQFLNALAGYGGDGVELELFPFDVGSEFFQLLRICGVNLGGADDHGFLCKGEFDFRARIIVHGLLGSGNRETGQLLVDDFEVFYRIRPATGVADVDKVEKQAGSFDVAQELSAETGAEVRAFNEAGHVGDDVGKLIGLFADCDDAEVGLEGGEGVVGNFGLGGRDAGDQGRLAGIGVAYEADVGEQLEDEAVVAFFAGATELVFAGGLVDGGGKVLIAAASATTFGDDDAFIGGFEIVDQLARVLVEERGADGNLEDDGVAVEAGAVGAHAMLAALALVLGVVAEVDEGVVALRADHDDVAAVAAVAAGGTAAGDEFFAAEGHAAIAAVAGLDANFCFIDEHWGTWEQGLGNRNQGLGTRD